MDMKLHWIFIIALAILTSCGKQIPSNVLSPKEMEEVLYDYHLAMGLNTLEGICFPHDVRIAKAMMNIQ